MTMPQMPRPGTESAATRALKAALAAAERDRENAKEGLEKARNTVADWETKVRAADDAVRELESGLVRLRGAGASGGGGGMIGSQP